MPLNYWWGLGRDSQKDWIWGELQLSLNERHQVILWRSGFQSQCSCGQAARPCKHSLALLLLSLEQDFDIRPLPEWGQIFYGRIREDLQVPAPGLGKAPKIPLERYQNGLQGLEQFLLDLAAQGLANLSQAQALWKDQVLQLRDAQMPRLSGRLLGLSQALEEQSRPLEEIAGELAGLYRLVQSMKRFEALSPAQQDELLEVLGLSRRKQQIWETGERLRDSWRVLGFQYEASEEGLAYRQTWLYGENSQRLALIVDFNPLNKGYEQHYWPGSLLQEALAVFYPGQANPRALILHQGASWTKDCPLPPAETQDIAAMQAQLAQLRAYNPWQEDIPAIVQNLQLVEQEGQQYWVDAQGLVLPLDEQAPKLHGLYSQSLWPALFGLWDGFRFKPLAGLSAGLWQNLPEK